MSEPSSSSRTGSLGLDTLTGTSTRSFTRTTSRTTNTSRTTPTFPSSIGSTRNDFHLTTIAAIVIPIIAVVSILAIIYRRWRRARAPRMVVVTAEDSHPVPPKHQTWNEAQSYSQQPRPDGMGTFQQHFVQGSGPWSAPTSPPPPPPPSSGTPYWENSGMGGGPVPGAAWGQSGLNSYNQQTHYDVPAQDPQLMRNPSMYGSQVQASGNAYGQPVEESGRMTGWEQGPIRTPSTTGTQNQPSGATSTMPVGESTPSARMESNPHVAHGSWAGNHGGGQSFGGGASQAQNLGSGSQQQPDTMVSPPPQPGLLAGGYDHTPASTSTTEVTRHKGEVVLEWTPQSESVSATHQAGPSNSHAESQPAQDTPELNILRERVQRLEAALGERAQPDNAEGEPDKPPPAYDSLPTPGPRGSGLSGADTGTRA